MANANSPNPESPSPERQLADSINQLDIVDTPLLVGGRLEVSPPSRDGVTEIIGGFWGHYWLQYDDAGNPKVTKEDYKNWRGAVLSAAAALAGVALDGYPKVVGEKTIVPATPRQVRKLARIANNAIRRGKVRPAY